jgi:hypothetical protein
MKYYAQDYINFLYRSKDGENFEVLHHRSGNPNWSWDASYISFHQKLYPITLEKYLKTKSSWGYNSKDCRALIYAEIKNNFYKEVLDE